MIENWVGASPCVRPIPMDIAHLATGARKVTPLPSFTRKEGDILCIL